MENRITPALLNGGIVCLPRPGDGQRRLLIRLGKTGGVLADIIKGIAAARFCILHQLGKRNALFQLMIQLGDRFLLQPLILQRQHFLIGIAVIGIILLHLVQQLHHLVVKLQMNLLDDPIVLRHIDHRFSHNHRRLKLRDVLVKLLSLLRQQTGVELLHLLPIGTRRFRHDLFLQLPHQNRSSRVIHHSLFLLPADLKGRLDHCVQIRPRQVGIVLPDHICDVFYRLIPCLAGLLLFLRSEGQAVFIYF